MSEAETRKASIDISDSPALQHSDHPRMLLVSMPLEVYNHGQWSHVMHINLNAKHKTQDAENYDSYLKQKLLKFYYACQLR